MNPAPESEFDPASETERIALLLSRQFDGDLTPDETAKLAATDSQSAGVAGWTDLRHRLQALPVRPVAESFSAGVRNAIDREMSAQPALGNSVARSGWMTRGIVAVSVTACLATLMLIVRTPVGNTPDMPMASTSDRTALESSLANRSVALADSELKEAAPEISAEQEVLRPFLENADWRIVVVQVRSKDREEVLSDIEQLVAKNGMDIRPVSGVSDGDGRFGVLLTSAGVDDKAFVESILPQADTQSADWNAQSVAASTRQNLIARLQESMKIPTHSEIHFGQVYVTLPKSTDRPGVEPSLVAKDSTADTRKMPSVAAGKVASSESELKARQTEAAAVQKLPVLVVFEFSDEAPNHI
ncbi:MAG: hypothetical protein KDB01_21490 [Planctomycetaceae bacterium]|nr:hypothetical protein [Planctomycetaceae bacterium]